MKKLKIFLFFLIILSILAECNRVPLQSVDGVENSDYINAVFVQVCITNFFMDNYLVKISF